MSATANGYDGRSFVVTVDVEADNEWAGPTRPTYDNIQMLPAFQRLCDRYGVRPTYLVTYDVASDCGSSGVLRDLLEQGNCEIGAHMHGWRTPPLYPPLDADGWCHAYIYEYPTDIQSDKLRNLTDQLRRTFQTPVHSHRAGRWGIDQCCLHLLGSLGYEADCSVTPFRSWKSLKGDPSGDGGPDFVLAPTQPYHPVASDLNPTGKAALLEVPVSVRVLGPLARASCPRTIARLMTSSAPIGRPIRRAVRKLRLAELVSLNPATNLSDNMIRLCRFLLSDREPVINMALHSSELMAGGSPLVGNEADQRRVWQALDRLFELLSHHPRLGKQTLTEYARHYREHEGA